MRGSTLRQMLGSLWPRASRLWMSSRARSRIRARWSGDAVVPSMFSRYARVLFSPDFVAAFPRKPTSLPTMVLPLPLFVPVVVYIFSVQNSTWCSAIQLGIEEHTVDLPRGTHCACVYGLRPVVRQVRARDLA